MPHYRRLYIPGSWYFFTVVAHERRPILISELARKSLRTAIDATRAAFPFTTVAWVLLPDHLHCIWRLPDGDADFTTRWRLIKTRFGRSYLRAGGVAATEISSSRLRRKEHGVWQRRFWEHCLRGEDDLQYHIAYIHHNPVKHGLVEEPRAWPHSSIHRHEYSDWGAGAPEKRMDKRHLEGE
jgi:putative transposase